MGDASTRFSAGDDLGPAISLALLTNRVTYALVVLRPVRSLNLAILPIRYLALKQPVMRAVLVNHKYDR